MQLKAKLKLKKKTAKLQTKTDWIIKVIKIKKKGKKE